MRVQLSKNRFRPCARAAKVAAVVSLLLLFQSCGPSVHERAACSRLHISNTIPNRDHLEKKESLRLEFATAQGEFLVDLYPQSAPRHVERFVSLLDEYEGSVVCESHAGGFLVFGCFVSDAMEGKPVAVDTEHIVPDEIDGERMPSLDRRLTDPKELDYLWQQEIYPRYRNLRSSARPVPPRLAALMEDVRRRGTEATAALYGKSRRWYLETIGFRYTAGSSARPLRRGAIASASIWPEESDARFLAALADLPDRSGRSTVFGAVVEGMEVLDSIAALPVNKSHEPRNAVYLSRVSLQTSRARSNEE